MVSIKRSLYKLFKRQDCFLPSEWEDPQFLVVLAEEELVVIDLMDETWPSLPLPYLSSSHASAITCCEHIDAVSDIVFQKIVNLSNKQMKSNAVSGNNFHFFNNLFFLLLFSEFLSFS